MAESSCEVTHVVEWLPPWPSPRNHPVRLPTLWSGSLLGLGFLLSSRL